MPDCGAEICGNGLDDDCDGDVDAADVEDCCQFSDEICGDGKDNDCDGKTDLADACPPEICGNQKDDDGDGLIDEAFPDCIRPPEPVNPQDGCSDKAKCGECDGEPVDLLNRDAYIGPHEDVRIASPQGGLFDLAFTRTWDNVTAAADHERDLASTTSQEGGARVLGPGWRHSYDIRLELEGTQSVDGGPMSVRFTSPMDSERLFFMASGWYGRVPGRKIEATQLDSTTWHVLDDDGTVYEFVTVGSTLLHGSTTAQLKYIIPNGLTHARVRLYYEGDADIPSNWCTDVRGAGTGCAGASGGLLVAVADQWLDGTTWRNGSSLHLKYAVVPHAGQPTEYRLALIREGADVDDGIATASATILAEYTYQPGSDSPSWRQELQKVSSCVYMTSGGADVSGSSCAASAPSEKYSYTMDAVDPFLISTVAVQRRTIAGPFGALQESFIWEPEVPLNNPYARRVVEHQSPGIVLQAQEQGPDRRNDVMAWIRNGVARTYEFQDGHPIAFRRGTQLLNSRERAPSAENGLESLGVARSESPNQNEITLRTFFEDGRVDVEAVVVPSTTSAPTMQIGSGACDKPGFTGVSSVRRVSRHYYTMDSVSDWQR